MSANDTMNDVVVGNNAEIPFDRCTQASFQRDILTTLVYTIICGFFIITTNKYLKTAPEQRRKGNANKPPHDADVKYSLTMVDHIFGALTILVAFVNMAVRAVRGVAYWVVQPCHVLTFALIYIIYSKESRITPFRYFLYFSWMPVVGLFNADYSWFSYDFEVPLFYIHHLLVTIVPFYYLFTRRFHTDLLVFDPAHSHKYTTGKGRVCFFLNAVAWASIYHVWVLVWFGWYMNEDFNGMRCVPPIPILTAMGPHWREGMFAGATLLSIIMGLLPEALAMAMWGWRRGKKQASKIVHKMVDDIPSTTATTKKGKSKAH
eukprot:TRINITY_DN5360_c0_g1_i4.p1 TRINITY_DN5360_c0_g1~~TRINITY_DN5360_c0_g1_i4.p1  ORF type:complete len:327 (-),score=47.39 TRINITY_DN5360_c0_g1_i4:70-1023(-)